MEGGRSEFPQVEQDQVFPNVVQSDDLSDSMLQIFNFVNHVILSSIVGIFGITANIINIVVFKKQGFSNTVNISFLGIAVSDLGCLLTTEWICALFNPIVENSVVPWVPLEMIYLTGAWPHIVCTRITSYITVYVTAERYLCTAAPLKVKQIVTPARTTCAIFTIYLINVLSLLPEYATSYLEWRFFPHNNRTLLSITYSSYREKVTGIAFFLSFIFGTASFVAVITFTSLLVLKLKQSSEWRRMATSGRDQNGPMSDRESKTVKTVVLVASIHILCNTPGTLLTMVTVVEPAFIVGGRYTNMARAMWTIASVFETVNSSVNIFLYYKTSSKYRQTFAELFSCVRKEKKLKL